MLIVEINSESQRSLSVQMEKAEQRVSTALSQGIRAATIHLTTVYKRDILSGQILKRRSGNLSRSIFHEMESEHVGVVGAGREAKYARSLNDGARPHVIEAGPGKMLAFTPGADAIRSSAFVTPRSVRKVLAQNRIFRQRVNHPGNPPYRFMQLGLAMATPEIRRIITERVANAVPSKGQAE